MPVTTYDALATTTTTGTVSSVTFSSINQTYTDLILVCQFAFDTNNNSLQIRFNSDTGTNYSYTSFEGYNATYDSYKTSNQTKLNVAGVNIGAGTSLSYPGTCTIQINNYVSSYYKVAVSQWTTNNDSGSRETGTLVGSWRSNSAISSITILSQNNIISGSKFVLYGIKKA